MPRFFVKPIVSGETGRAAVRVRHAFLLALVALVLFAAVVMPADGRAEMPDFRVGLRYVGVPDPQLQDLLRWTASVRLVGELDFAYTDSLYTIDFWVVDPAGLRATSRLPMVFSGSELRGGFEIPELQLTATRNGEYCAHVAIIAGPELDNGNSAAVDCMAIAPGPVRVVPNVATPNGDGANDTIDFLVANSDLTAPRVEIFDLSGRRLFTTDRILPGRRLRWDGTDEDGDPVPPGAYLYRVIDGGRTVAAGTCGVIR
ncbi:MAG: gliding motility-associated C-terminal domain-containing protein [Candidatus Krumholzibacteriia bacterium]